MIRPRSRPGPHTRPATTLGRVTKKKNTTDCLKNLTSAEGRRGHGIGFESPLGHEDGDSRVIVVQPGQRGRVDVGRDIPRSISPMGMRDLILVGIVSLELKFQCARARLPLFVLRRGLDDTRDVEADLVNAFLAVPVIKGNEQPTDSAGRTVASRGEVGLTPPCPLVT